MFSRSYFTDSYFPYPYWTHTNMGVVFDGAMLFTLTPRGNNMLRVLKLDVEWLTGTTGDVTAEAPRMYGWLLKIVTTPSAVAAPALGYNIDLIGEDGVDIMGGAAHGMDSVNKEEVYPTIIPGVTPVFTCGGQSLRISGTGGPAAGNASLYFLESLGKKNVA